MTAFTNASIVLEDGILYDGTLLVQEGRICAVGAVGSVAIPADAEIVDAKGRYIGPGFVDLHCHGGDGARFDTDPETAAAYYLRHGTTTILATLYYDLSQQQMLESIARVRKLMTQPGVGSAVGGIYMEGPYMNPTYGASPEKNQWRGPIEGVQAQTIIRQAGDAVRVWAIAPERAGIAEFARMARAENPNVVLAVGHSQATPAQIFALKNEGLRLQTHCTNATGRVETAAGTRSCGPDEACFYDRDFYAEVICDSHGVHVHPDMLRLILRIKGAEKIILITDGFVSDLTPPASMRHITDLHFDANGGLCGSKLTMDTACRNMMRHTPSGICQVFQMASGNPARLLGLDAHIGSIAVGKRANLVLVDDKLNLQGVWLDGVPAT